MYSRHRQKNKPTAVQLIAMALAVLVLAVTFGIFLKRNADKKNEQLEKEKLNIQLLKYQNALNEYTKEQEMLKKERAQLSERGKSLSTVFFTECGTGLYDAVFLKKLQPKGFTGTVVLSTDNLFDKEGCVTAAQLKEMIDAGWSVAIGWYGETAVDFSEYMNFMKKRFSESALPFSDILFFPEGRYSEEVEKEALAYGFRNIVYKYGERSSEDPPLEKEDGVMYLPYLFSSNKVKIGEKLSLYMQAGQCCAVAVKSAVEKVIDENDINILYMAELFDYINSNAYYRSFTDYRAEKVETGTQVADRLKEIEKRIEEIKTSVDEINNTVASLLSAQSDDGKPS